MEKHTLQTRAAGNAFQSRAPLSTLAAAVLLVAVGWGSTAHAVGFGKLRVMSALGQPLQAEVEILDAKSSVKAGLASANNYSQRGLEYNPLVSSIRTSVQENANGRMVLRITSDRPFNDPFVDIILNATDGNGEVVRDFSILLDPPAGARPAPAVTAPQVAPVVRPRPQATPAVRERPTADTRAFDEPAARPTRRRTGAVRSGNVRVRSGDTASQIAVSRRPGRVSLDQMLLAMLRANPHAFIDGNINRLKAGVVLKMPTLADARSTSTAEARQLLYAQSGDFRGYRRKMAQSATTQASADARQSSGNVQTDVRDTQTTPATSQDSLQLSQGAVSSKTEQRIAKAAEQKANSSRAAELNQNLNDLKRISAAAASAPAGTGGATPPAIAVPAPTITVNIPANIPTTSVTPPVGTPASVPTPTAAPVVDVAASQANSAASIEDVPASAQDTPEAVASATPPAPAPVVQEPTKPQPKPTPVQPPAPQEPGIIDTLLDNLLLLGGGLALLGGLVFFLVRRRKQKADEISGLNSSFTDSNLASDSFFHATGGKSVDTSENPSSTTAANATPDLNQSSMLYSPSQLDADSDVDPVSEADVYLAYGRDAQAEEILKDALLKTPTRAAIHGKLLEIYNRRRDLPAYARTATDLKRVTNGTGPEWETACKTGFALDPNNPLYAEARSMAAAAPAAQPQEETLVEPPAAPVAAAPEKKNEPVAEAASDALAMDDMVHASTFDAVQLIQTQEPPAPAPVTPPPAPAPQPTIKASLLQQPSLSPSTALPPKDEPTSQPATVPLGEELIDLSLDLPDLTDVDSSAPRGGRDSEQSLDFDMGSLSLDLEEPSASQIPQALDASPLQADGMATKLELAEEFLAIGDKEGARTMAQEVAENAQGALKQNAEAFLRKLG